MIDGVFTKEKEEMRILINAKTYLQNFIYRIRKDENMKKFLSELIDNIKHYDSMERMDKYYFENDFKEVYEVLHILYAGLISDSGIKKKTAVEMIECCSVFPDNIGRETISLLSYIPIIDLFREELSYQEAFTKFIDDEKEFMGESIVEHQENKILNSPFRRKFFDDKDFIDYGLRNRYSQKLKDEHESGRCQEIKGQLEVLLSIYDDSVDLNKTKLHIGMGYWNERKKQRDLDVEKFRDLILAMVGSVDNE